MVSLFRKSLGGEFVITTVKTPPGWPVHLCIVAGITLVEALYDGNRKFLKLRVLLNDRDIKITT